jgi:hypothetical protein
VHLRNFDTANRNALRAKTRLDRGHSLLLATQPIIEALERRMLLSVNVLTYHNDNARDGANLNETTLTPANVNSTTFGQLFSYPVDGYVYAQPLYVANVPMGNNEGTHNIVLVATEHDSVYAFDADSNAGSNSQPLWQDSFINPATGITTVPAGDVLTGDIVPEIGITGTPVIDANTNTMYVVTNTKIVSGGNTSYQQQLHALNITTGAEEADSPVTISFSTNGTGPNNNNGVEAFDPLIQNQRGGLALNNGNVYIDWASHGDNGFYHGLVASFNASTLQFESALNTTPNGSKGGIWMGGDAPAIDSNGNLFITVGNGTFDDGGGDFGDSFLRITDSNNLAIADSFTPFNQQNLDSNDIDFGSGGVLLLPTQPGANPDEAVSGGKDGNLYVVNRNNLGGFGASSNTNIQTFSVTNNDGVYSTPAYFNNTVYVQPSNQGIESLPLVNGQLTGPSATGSTDYSFPGATISISANGNSNGIAWDVEYGQNAVLHAYDTSNVADELYNSNQAGSRDQLGAGVKFAVPTVADGHVFVGTASTLAVFGLLSDGATTAPAAPSSLVARAESGTDIHLSWNQTSTNATTFLIDRSTNGGAFQQIAAVGPNTTNYDDAGAAVGTTYSYEVIATNSAGSSGPSNVVSTTTPTIAGLVGYWQFNEGDGVTTADASGNNDTGTLTGETTWIAGRIGSAALNFHGAGVQNAHVDIPNEPQLQFTAGDSFTLSAWAHANALDSKWAGIVTKSNDIAPGYGLYIDPNNHWAAATSAGTNVIEGPLADTNWHLLTLVQNAATGTRQFYVDGTLAGTGAAEDGSGAGDLWVGGSASSIQQFFNGGVDDVRVYNIALAQTDIAALAAVPATPAPGTGSISGTIYEDPNATGLSPTTQNPVSGDTVFLDLLDNGVLEPNEPISITDVKGDFSFSGLGDGTYRVEAIASNEEHIADPIAAFQDVTISGGSAVTGINFGQTPNNEVPPASQFSLKLLSKVPAAVVSGTTKSFTFRVTNTSGRKFSAPLELSIFLSSSNVLNGAAQLADGPIFSKITLAKAQSHDYAIHLTYPSGLSAGQYYLIGSVIANKSVGETQATAVSPSQISISPANVALTASFRSRSSAFPVKPGKQQTAIVSIANGGNVVANGNATIELFASTDGQIDGSSTLLRTRSRHIHIAAGRSGSFAIPFKAPSGLPAGSYSLMAEVTSNTKPADSNSGNDIATIRTA